ncbi:MAG: hypothetical protein DRN71_03190 [Candidatus Nanohalarchaeota archaeon]|nr:MAG: hypothetical protein DRN71_03190 [Candidatus Nanohaloarchaeota archaeon]
MKTDSDTRTAVIVTDDLIYVPVCGNGGDINRLYTNLFACIDRESGEPLGIYLHTGKDFEETDFEKLRQSRVDFIREQGGELYMLARYSDRKHLTAYHITTEDQIEQLQEMGLLTPEALSKLGYEEFVDIDTGSPVVGNSISTANEAMDDPGIKGTEVDYRLNYTDPDYLGDVLKSETDTPHNPLAEITRDILGDHPKDRKPYE